MARQSLIPVVAFGVFIALAQSNGLAQAPDGEPASFPESWPGSRAEADELASEPKDAAWSAGQEADLARGIQSSDWFEATALAVECRSWRCGIYLEAFVPVLADDIQAEGRAVHQRVTQWFFDLSERAGLAGGTGNSVWTAEPDGISVSVEYFASDVSRQPSAAPGAVEAMAPSLFGPDSLSGRFSDQERDEEWSATMEGLIRNLVAREEWQNLVRAEVQCRTTMCGVLLIYEDDRQPERKIRAITDTLREAFGINGVAMAETTVPGSGGTAGFADIVLQSTREVEPGR